MRILSCYILGIIRIPDYSTINYFRKGYERLTPFSKITKSRVLKAWPALKKNMITHGVLMILPPYRY